MEDDYEIEVMELSWFAIAFETVDGEDEQVILDSEDCCELWFN